MATLNQITFQNLLQADLNNEEILQLAILYSQVEDIGPYHKHVQVLRSKYQNMIEMLTFEMALFQYRDQIGPRQLRNILVALEDDGYEPLFYDIIQCYQQDVNAASYIRTLNDAFGIQPDEDFCQEVLRFIDQAGTEEVPESDDLLQEEFPPESNSDETENTLEGPGISSITNYLINRIIQVSKYADTPTYVKHFNIETGSLPTVELVINSDMSIQEIAEAIISRSRDVYNLDVPENSVVNLVEQLEKLPREALDSQLAKFRIDPGQIIQVQENVDLFRVYGPVNPHPSDDYSDLLIYESEKDEPKPDIEKIYGGPRMLLSMEYEYDQERDLPMDDWFVGYCYQCLKKIKKRCYARRVPLIRGGWLGCYCSQNCVETYIVNGWDTDPNLAKKQELELELSREFDRQINQIGILDQNEVSRKSILDIFPDDPDGGYQKVLDLMARLPKLS